MDNISALQRRNIELETELRLIKEQLAEARYGTQYLINCLSGQYAQFNIRDTSYRGITGCSHSEHQTGEDLISGPTFTEATACVGSLDQDSATVKAESLIDFEDHGHSLPAVVEQTEATTRSPTPILIDSPLQDQVEWHAHRSPNHVTTSPSRLSSNANETPTPHYPRAGPRGYRPAQVPRAHHPRPFEDHEHNRLMGSAMFIEEMNEEEQMQHWKEFQFRNRNHSAPEWKTYYDSVIRPAFLLKYGDAAVKAEPNAVQTISPPLDVKDLWFKKDESAQEPFRSVVINSLKAGITLTEVWSDFGLGWDKVVSATLLKTSGMKTVPPLETDSAMVVFKSAGFAEEFVERYVADAVLIKTASRAA